MTGGPVAWVVGYAIAFWLALLIGIALCRQGRDL